MESLYKYSQSLAEKRFVNEDKLLQKLSNCLDNGGDIDFVFLQSDFDYLCDYYSGTILHYAIFNNYKRLVEYALSRGANIAAKISSKEKILRHRSALDITLISNVGETVWKRSLELYSSFGLTSFHLDCAFGELESKPELQQYLQANYLAQISSAVSTASPIWPGMTPVLIASKFEQTYLLECLLDLGANPLAQDPEGNTALHYQFDAVDSWCDKRLFALDPTMNTFGSFTGGSHFHLACFFYPESQELLESYLNQGISPDLPTKSPGLDIPSGRVGLHTAAEKACPKMIQLLLEHGADIDKQDSNGDSPIELFFKTWSWVRDSGRELNRIYKCICLFIEGGSNQEKVDMNLMLKYLSHVSIRKKQVFVGCVIKLTTLNEDLVSKELMVIYFKVLQQLDDWDEYEYARCCSQELTSLSCRGLQKILDDTIIVRPNFKKRFEFLDSFDFKGYPIYGHLLKMKWKRKLLELEKKREKMPKVILQIQNLFRSLCRLPDLCAGMILWDLSSKELDKFLA